MTDLPPYEPAMSERERQLAAAIREAYLCLTYVNYVPRQPGRPQSRVRAEAAQAALRPYVTHKEEQ